MNVELKTKIDDYCYLIQRGKPSALLQVPSKYINEAMEIVEGYEGLYYINKYLTDDWREFWIYGKPFMLEVIESLPEKPKTVYDHWIIGKAFGYSDEAIEEFVVEFEKEKEKMKKKKSRIRAVQKQNALLGKLLKIK